MKAITLDLGLDVHQDFITITIAIAESGSRGEIRFPRPNCLAVASAEAGVPAPRSAKRKAKGLPQQMTLAYCRRWLDGGYAVGLPLSPGILRNLLEVLQAGVCTSHQHIGSRNMNVLGAVGAQLAESDYGALR